MVARITELGAAKSDSLEALVFGERRVVRAHDEAVRETLGEAAGRIWLALPDEARAETIVLALTHAIHRETIKLSAMGSPSKGRSTGLRSSSSASSTGA